MAVSPYRYSVVFQAALIVLILVLPAVVFWPPKEITNPNLTNLTSYAIISLTAIGSLFTLHTFANFPGERSLLAVIPVLGFWFGTLMALVATLRLPYSVYYLSAAMVLLAIFLFADVSLKRRRPRTMVYIPISGMGNLPEHNNIHWQKLDTPQLPPMPVAAVVTNLHAPDLDPRWQKFLADCTLQGIAVYNIRQVEESLTGRVKIRHMYENDLGSLLPSPGYLLMKQVLDTAFVLLTAPLTVPLMLMTALAIRLESPGPALFVQNRVGQRAREFKIYKFRSMRTDSEQHGAQFAQTADARVTRVGRFIRKTRLDELPQFWNILKGDMSLIGPRPEQKAFVDAFEHSIPFYNYRHIVKPGISGWAQVMHGYAADEDATRIKVEHDFYYIKHFSFSLDVLIFFKTIKTMLTGFGAR